MLHHIMVPKGKRLPTNSGQTGKQPNSSRSYEVTTPLIAYDLLADSIIRKQNINKVSSQVSDSLTTLDTVSNNTRSSTKLVEIQFSNSRPPLRCVLPVQEQ